MSIESVTKRIPKQQRDIIDALIVRGDSDDAIIAYAHDKLNRELTPEDITEIRTADNPHIAKLRAEVKVAVKVDSDKILEKTHSLLEKKLDKALKDMTKRETLDEEYASSIIDDEEYSRKTAKLADMTVAELLKISESLASKMPARPAQSALPGPEDVKTHNFTPEQTKALVAALSAGDPIELQRIIFPATQ